MSGLPEQSRDTDDSSVTGPVRDLEGTWPHALSHEPLLRVSDVLALVQPEFPTLTTSKLRFLDTHALVSPYRTAAGYRQYSPADVERLRFVLRQQRDHYRPLSIIGEHLAALDAGRMQEAVEPHAIDGEETKYLSRDGMAERAGVATEIISELEDAGLVTQAVPDGYARASLPLVVAAGAYVRAGGDVRSMRTLRNAAIREADHAANVAAPARARGDHGQAQALAQDRGEAAISLFSACVREQLGA
jgi:DNA-binding transcriptional MerR regulator